MTSSNNIDISFCLQSQNIPNVFIVVVAIFKDKWNTIFWDIQQYIMEFVNIFFISVFMLKKNVMPAMMILDYKMINGITQANAI